MESKSVLQSKTMLGIILAALATFVDMGPQLQGIIAPSLIPHFKIALQVAGFIIAVWGRTVATQPVSGIVTPKAPEKTE